MRTLKIYRKMIIYSLLIATIPLLVLGATLFVRTRQTIEDELVSSYRSVVNVHISNLLNRSDAYRELVESLMTSELLNQVLAYDGPVDSAYVAAGRSLDQDIRRMAGATLQTEIHLISVYSDNPLAAIVSDHVVPWTHVPRAELDELLRVRDEATSPVYVATRTAGLRKSVVSITAPFLGYDSATLFNRKAVVQVDVSTDGFLGNAIPTFPARSEYGTYVFTESGTVILSRPAADIDITEESIWEVVEAGIPERPDGIAVTRRPDGFVLVPAGNALTLRYAFAFPLGEFRDKLDAVVVELGILYVVLGSLLVTIAVRLAKPYKRRIARLIEKIGAVKQGDLRDDEPVGGHDEISVVDEHLSDMVRQLRGLLATVYEEELQLKEAQLTALESQMNPHFLFNSLELINSIAAVHQNHEVCVITEHLGRMLRYSLDSGSSHSATLEQEVSNVQDYIAIHAFRFEGAVTLDLQMDDQSKAVLVPRFCLQPLVENCIKHGFPRSPVGAVIRIRTRVEDQTLRIEVEDNGVGIDPDTLRRLRSLMQRAVDERHVYSKRNGRIGLSNVFARLALTHGDSFRMTFDDIGGAGTRITIAVPAGKKEPERV